MLKRCFPFRTQHSQRRQRLMTEPGTSQEAHTLSPHPITCKNHHRWKVNMVHLCLKMEQAGLHDCRIMISAGDFLMSLRVAWRHPHILCVSPGAGWLAWIPVPFHHCCLEMHFLVCFLLNKLFWLQSNMFSLLKEIRSHVYWIITLYILNIMCQLYLN